MSKIYTLGGKVLHNGLPFAAPAPSYDLLLTSEEGNFTKDGSNLISLWSDGSGNGNDAEQNNGTYQPTWNSNVDGSPAVLFNSNYIQIPNCISNTVFTLGFWFKPVTTSGYLFTYTTTTLGSSVVCQAYYSGGKVNLYYGPNFLNGTTSITAGNWYYLSVSYSGTEWKYYIDGVLQVSRVDIRRTSTSSIFLDRFWLSKNK